MAPRVRLRFRTKVWAALCGVAAAALAIALLIAQDAALGRARAETRARFDRTLAAFHELQQLRARYVSAEIDALSRANPQLRTVLSTASLAGEDLGLGGARPEDALHDANLRLQSALPSLALDPKLALFALADADGRLVFSRADPERYGADLRELGLVRKVGEGARATWIWLDGDAQVDGARLAPAYPSPALYLVRGEPVVFGDVVHGIVLLGEPLDRELLESLRAISGVDLALVSRGRAIATTLSTAQAAQLGARLAALALAEARPQPMAELQLGSERFLALRAELDPGTPLPDASFVLLTSLAPELAFVRDLRQTLAAVGLALFAVALAVGYALARERELIKSTLERYVSKSVAAELLREPGRVALAGARRELTVLFVDLGGFTPLAEELPPEAVVAQLNEYFDAVCGAVLDQDGTVKEFQGDGVVAFWGAPIAQPDHAPRAARAALAAAARLDRLRERWSARGAPAPGYRIGLHSAELVAGEIGSAARGAYGIVGDGMNLAARIEAANKLYGTHVLSSGATHALLGPGFLCREIDHVRVVGRRQPVRLFELVALAGEADAHTQRRCALYERALAAYRARDFAAAAVVLAELPEDGPARLLASRARELEASPPPPEWDAILALDSK